MATFCVLLPDKIRRGPPRPMGTGFFVSPDGWFVTAAHVITEDNAPDGKVRSDLDKTQLHKESRVDLSQIAELMKDGLPKNLDIGRLCLGVSFGHVLPELDVALLKVDFSENAQRDGFVGRTGFPHLTVSSRKLLEGESVYSFGYPLSESELLAQTPHFMAGSLSLCPRVTSAIVSSTIDATKLHTSGADPQVYVLDKALNYGNSGGPIVSPETGYVHALCSRFQPVYVPQHHLRDDKGNVPSVVIPSLYGVVSSLRNKQLLSLLEDLQVPIDSTP